MRLRVGRGARRAAAALAVGCWCLAAAPALGVPAEQAAQRVGPGVSSPESAVALVDVPFISQEEDLCGGAAAAMLLRYWGGRGVTAVDFRHLVDDEVDGIHATDLVAELRRRGWTARPFTGTGEQVRARLQRGQPTIALIEVRPGRDHYVVITAWTPERVLFHDPAVAPYRAMATEEFADAWQAAGGWALLVLPPAGVGREHGRPTDADHAEGLATPPRTVYAEAPTADRGPDLACRSRIEAGVTLARAGHPDAAGHALLRATEDCPDSGRAFRELAALRFRQERWDEAAAAAGTATRLTPEDDHAWRLLATASYLGGDSKDALAAWNRVGEPRLDLIQVRGLRRLRHHVVEERIDLSSGSLLSPGDLLRARRRVARIPAVESSRVEYRPLPDGRGSLEVAVVEAPLLGTGWAHWLREGTRALAEQEVRVDLSNPTGRGEALRARWRWEDNRPRGRFEAAIPDVLGIPGLLHLEALAGEATYALDGIEGAVLAAHGLDPAPTGSWLVETRRHAGISMSGWIGQHLRLRVGTALDRWSTRGDDVTLRAGLEGRYLDHRLRITVDAARAVSLGSERPHSGWGGEVGWRSSADWRAPMLRIRTGYRGVAEGTPLQLWPRADKESGARAPMRGHDLRDDGVVTGSLIGRRLLWVGAEASAFPARLGPVRLGGSLFVDTARSWMRLREGDSGWQVDVGSGVHLGLPGAAGTLSLYVGTGLRGGETTLSAAWVTSADDWW